MAKADSASITRRVLVRTGLAAAIPMPAAALPAGDDAVLLQLGREFDEALRAENAVIAAYRKDEETDDEVLDAAVEKTFEIVEQIIKMPARTRAGIEVKARAIAWWQGPSGKEDDPPLDYFITEALLADLRALVIT